MDNKAHPLLHNPGPSTLIVFVALLQLLTSGAVLAFWGELLWGIVVFDRRYPKNHQVFAPAIWIFYIALPVCFALLGAISSIGLLRLREWARQRTVFLSVVPVSVYALLLVLRPVSLFPPESGGGMYDIGGVPLFVVECLVAVLIPLSICWLTIFTWPSVKAQFRSGEGPT